MADSDTLYHRLFSHPLMVEGLIQEFVPEAMTAGLDFSRMQRVNAVADQIALPPDSPLWPFQPQVRFHVLNMGAFPRRRVGAPDMHGNVWEWLRIVGTKITMALGQTAPRG